MSLWDEFKGRQELPIGTPVPVSIDRGRLAGLESLLFLRPDREILTGHHKGHDAEQWLAGKGIRNVWQGIRPVEVFDVDQMRLSEDKNMGKRLAAAKHLAMLGGREAYELLDRASRDNRDEKEKQAIKATITDFTANEIKRQVGGELARRYREMAGQAMGQPSPLKLLEEGAVYFLAMMKHPEAMEFLLLLARAAEPRIRCDATEALGEHYVMQPAPETAELLKSMLETDPAGEVRAAAGQALRHVCRPETLAVLVRFLADSDLRVRHAVAESAAVVARSVVVTSQTSPYDLEAKAILDAAVHDADPSVAALARDQLQKIGAVDELSVLLASCDAASAVTRRDVALKLRSHADHRVVEALVLMLQDEDEFVRINAARSLAAVGDQSALAALEAAMKEAAEDMRADFAEAISEIEVRSGKAQGP